MQSLENTFCMEKINSSEKPRNITKEKIYSFLETRGIGLASAWRNKEFLEYYVSLKRPIAERMAEILHSIDIGVDEFDITPQTLEMFRGLDVDATREYELKTEEERRILTDVFTRMGDLPPEERSRSIVEVLGIGEMFAETNPYFFRLGGVLVALVDEDEYGKIGDEGSCGFFTEKDKIPLVVVSTFEDGDDDESCWSTWSGYVHSISDDILSGESPLMAESIIEHSPDLPEKYKLFLSGEFDEEQELTEEERSELLSYIENVLYKFIPFKVWYVEYVLGRDSDNSISLEAQTVGYVSDDRPYEYDHYLQRFLDIYRHEVQHSINRFLPVSGMYGLDLDLSEDAQVDQNPNADDIVVGWIYRLADEVTAHAFEGRVLDFDYYAKSYEDATEFGEFVNREEVNTRFAEQAKLFIEINERIVRSDSHFSDEESMRELSCFFALEDPWAWKFLHNYLMHKDSFEFDYYQGDL